MSIRATAGSSFKINSDASSHFITFNEEDRRYPNIIPLRTSIAHAGGSGVRLYDGPDLKLFILVVGAGASCLLRGPPGSN